MEVKIGVRDVGREVVLESDDTPEDILAAVEESVTQGSLLRLTDEKGRLLVVPAANIAYVEIGAPSARRVGFGSV